MCQHTKLFGGLGRVIPNMLVNSDTVFKLSRLGKVEEPTCSHIAQVGCRGQGPHRYSFQDLIPRWNLLPPILPDYGRRCRAADLKKNFE